VHIPIVSEIEPEKIVFVDENASISERSTHLMVQLEFGE